MKTILNNGITIYGNKKITAAITQIIKQYFQIFVDMSTIVNIFKKNECQSILKKIKPKTPARIHFLKLKNRQIFDEIFDKFQTQNKWHYTTKFIPFNYLKKHI